MSRHQLPDAFLVPVPGTLDAELLCDCFHSCGYIPRRYSAGSCGGLVLHFLRNPPPPGAKGIALHLQALVTVCLWTLATQGIGRDLMGMYLPSPSDE